MFEFALKYAQVNINLTVSIFLIEAKSVQLKTNKIAASSQVSVMR